LWVVAHTLAAVSLLCCFLAEPLPGVSAQTPAISLRNPLQTITHEVFRAFFLSQYAIIDKAR
jgi:hypothetical protein